MGTVTVMQLSRPISVVGGSGSRRVGLGVNRPIRDTKLSKLVRVFRESMHMPDPAPLYAVVGTIAGNMLPGPPVWLMLIAGASGGKTELLLSTKSVPGVHLHGRLSGVAALLSGVPRKDVKAGSTGGILRQIGSNGILLLKDFTSVLSLPKDVLTEILGTFTELYDGEWSRDVGADGGRQLSWSGKLGFLAGCTPLIDRHHTAMGELGPRFMNFRYTETEGYAESRSALTRPVIDTVRENLCEAMREFFDGFDADEHREVELTEQELGRLIALATLSSRSRSPVARNNWTREVEEVPSWEMPARLSLEIQQLAKGMRAVGVGSEEMWRVLGKVALDGVPAARRVMLLALADCNLKKKGSGMTLMELTARSKCSSQTSRRALEDMGLHGVVRSSGPAAGTSSKGKGEVWELTDWMKEQWRIAYPKGYEGVLGEKHSGRA